MNLNPAKYVLNRFLLQRKWLIAKTRHFDLQLKVRTDDVVGRHLYKYGVHEPATTDFLKNALKFDDGDVVFDIGANIGWFSLIIDRLCGGNSVDIYSFEPDPTNFALLRENISRNSATHIRAQQLAVAHVADTLQLHLYGKSNLGRHSLLNIHEGETVDVKTVILDRFWDAQKLAARTPRFIKIDIEGFELMALRGASDVLRRCPMVMMEYSPPYMNAASIDPGDLIDLMLGHGFSANVLTDGKLVARDAGFLKQSDTHVDLFWTR